MSTFPSSGRAIGSRPDAGMRPGMGPFSTRARRPRPRGPSSCGMRESRTPLTWPVSSGRSGPSRSQAPNRPPRRCSLVLFSWVTPDPTGPVRRRQPDFERRERPSSSLRLRPSSEAAPPAGKAMEACVLPRLVMKRRSCSSARVPRSSAGSRQRRPLLSPRSSPKRDPCSADTTPSSKEDHPARNAAGVAVRTLARTDASRAGGRTSSVGT